MHTKQNAAATGGLIPATATCNQRGQNLNGYQASFYHRHPHRWQGHSRCVFTGSPERHSTTDIPTDGKCIRYDRETGDYACYLNGEFIGYAANYSAGEQLCNEVYYAQPRGINNRKKNKTMNLIFSEISEPVIATVKWYDEETGRTQTERMEFSTQTTAHYDADLRVLVVDQALVLPLGVVSLLLWALPKQRTLETHATAARAIRRAVALADNYTERLIHSVFNDVRTDAQVMAEYQAA